MALVTKFSKFKASQNAVLSLASRPTITIPIVTKRTNINYLGIYINGNATTGTTFTINLNGEEVTFNSIDSIVDGLGIIPGGDSCELILRNTDSLKNILIFSMKNFTVDNLTISFKNANSFTSTEYYYAVDFKANVWYLEEI